MRTLFAIGLLVVSVSVTGAADAAGHGSRSGSTMHGQDGMHGGGSSQTRHMERMGTHMEETGHMERRGRMDDHMGRQKGHGEDHMGGQGKGHGGSQSHDHMDDEGLDHLFDKGGDTSRHGHAAPADQ